MRIVAFSDWRVQSIQLLVKCLKSQEERPDVIVYGGDDIRRFNNPGTFKTQGGIERRTSKNYFEEIAKCAKHGLLVVAGNDECNDVTKAIAGEKVMNIHDRHIVLENYAFVGIEGDVNPLDPLHHTEEEIEKLLKKASSGLDVRRMVVVSHTPPYGVLDQAIRYGLENVGTKALMRFLEQPKSPVRLVVCGHVHSDGGLITKVGPTTVVNCASNDFKGAEGNVAIIDLDGDDVRVRWDRVTKGRFYHLWQLEEIMSIPAVSSARGLALYDAGFRSIDAVAKIPDNLASTLGQPLKGHLDYIINFARAISEEKPLFTDIDSFLINQGGSTLHFLDLEYTLDGELFLIGWMDSNGASRQIFIERPELIKDGVMELIRWLTSVHSTLIGYNIKGADYPKLIAAIEKTCPEVSPNVVSNNAVYDLYNDCVFTRSSNKQCVYLPFKNPLGLKEITEKLGYSGPVTQVRDGLDAVSLYSRFLASRMEEERLALKQDMLNYNLDDLKRTRFLFNWFCELFHEY